MKGAHVSTVRERVLDAPIDRVWRWMCDPEALDLFRVNPFHRSAELVGDELARGSDVVVDHVLGPVHERRVAHVSTLRPYEIGWSELEADGDDWFPHSQNLVLTAAGSERCRLVNSLRGSFHLRGARWWLVPWYRHVLPWVLELENRAIARAVTGAPPGP